VVRANENGQVESVKEAKHGFSEVMFLIASVINGEFRRRKKEVE
jgi:hypothetical protein